MTLLLGQRGFVVFFMSAAQRPGLGLVSQP